MCQLHSYLQNHNYISVFSGKVPYVKNRFELQLRALQQQKKMSKYVQEC